jgi:hypothetical protein
MVEFVAEYRAVWHDWRNGNQAAVWPLGTYSLRIYARVACAPAVPAQRARPTSKRLLSH